MITAAQRLTPQKANGEIPVESLNQILVNIGQESLSEEEMDVILADASAEGRSIPAEKLIELM